MSRQPFDPGLEQFLHQRPAAQVTPTPAYFRRRLSDALASRTDISGLPNRVTSQDIQPHGGVPVRVYRPPDRSPPHPALLYCHGGGWVAGSIATHDPFCRLLCEAAAITIVSLEYRLAPEHPFPAALDDARATLHWLMDHSADLAIDPARIGMGSDSSGAAWLRSAL